MNASASKNVRRYGQYQLGASAIVGWGAAQFTYIALTNDTIMMSPDSYGSWVTHFQAEWWSIPILLASIMHVMGVKINGCWRWSPLIRLIGCLVNFALFMAFIIGSGHSTLGDPMVAFGSGFAILYVWFIMLNIGDLAQSVKKWR